MIGTLFESRAKINALINLSKFTPSGINKGNMFEAIKSTVISGTPLQISINIVQSKETTGSLDLRPNASIIPIGKAKAIPVQPKTSVTRRPPHLLVETSVKPNPPLSKK